VFIATTFGASEKVMDGRSLIVSVPLTTRRLAAPPLTVSDAEIDLGLELLARAFTEVLA